MQGKRHSRLDYTNAYGYLFAFRNAEAEIQRTGRIDSLLKARD